eukprot:1161531-Pelagomonas_calceolata.AAC.5
MDLLLRSVRADASVAVFVGSAASASFRSASMLLPKVSMKTGAEMPPTPAGTGGHAFSSLCEPLWLPVSHRKRKMGSRVVKVRMHASCIQQRPRRERLGPFRNSHTFGGRTHLLPRKRGCIPQKLK